MPVAVDPGTLPPPPGRPAALGATRLLGLATALGAGCVTALRPAPGAVAPVPFVPAPAPAAPEEDPAPDEAGVLSEDPPVPPEPEVDDPLLESCAMARDEVPASSAAASREVMFRRVIVSSRSRILDNAFRTRPFRHCTGTGACGTGS